MVRGDLKAILGFETGKPEVVPAKCWRNPDFYKLAFQAGVAACYERASGLYNSQLWLLSDEVRGLLVELLPATASPCSGLCTH